MRYQISEGAQQDGFWVPERAGDCLATASEAELKVLFCACRLGSFEADELVQALAGSVSSDEALQALAFWRGAGLFSAPGAQGQTLAEPPSVKKITTSRVQYTRLELADAAEKNRDFKSLIDYAEHRLNKNFTATDLNILYSFVDYMALGVDVVMLAIEQCATEGKTSLRYIEKLLIALADEGIDSYEAADAYFTSRREYLSFEGQIRAMCGFSTRSLTAAEKKILAAWQGEGGFSMEEIRAAYERTVTAISKPSLSYMNKVLTTARTRGEAIDAISAEQQKATGKTYETNSRFQAALERTRKKVKQEDSQ